MSDRDLAEAIYAEITSDEPEGYAEAALTIWDGNRGAPRRDRMAEVLAFVACIAIDKVLARRVRLAARTGPWDGGRHCQEEDGYPGSLLPPKRGEP